MVKSRSICETRKPMGIRVGVTRVGSHSEAVHGLGHDVCSARDFGHRVLAADLALGVELRVRPRGTVGHAA